MSDFQPPPFIPTDRQQQFMQAVEHYDEAGYGGALGGGKTVSLCWFAHAMSTLYPGNVGAVFRNNLKDLRNTTLAEFRLFMSRYYPHQPVTWRMSPQIECEIDCGGGRTSTILWLEAKDPEKHLSLNIAWAAIDEASQTSREFWLTIQGRIGRHILPDGTRPPRRLAWASNPGPSWCKTEYPVGGTPARRTAQVDETLQVVRAFVPALHTDNPHLPAGYIANLRTLYPPVWLAKFLQGDWDAFEGMVFTEFDESAHVAPFAPDPLRFVECVNILAHDWGFRAPAAALCMSIDSDGDWWIWREHYQSEWTPAQHAPALKAMLSTQERWSAQLIDYAAQDQLTGTSLQSVYNAMPGYQFAFAACRKAKHGADGSIMLFKQMLAAGRVHISPACVNLIWEIKQARWQDHSADETAPDIMVDKDDHLLDCVFMGLEFWRQKAPKITDEMRAARGLRAKKSELDAMIRKLREQKEAETWRGGTEYRVGPSQVGCTKPNTGGWKL